MTEKVESMEIHPMRGHSRGEWYCTLDDIADSEQEAEYWAIFGVTHRGNRHCLGEFSTKEAAKSAIGEMKTANVATAPKRRGRRIVQIEVIHDRNEHAMVDIIALCDDGTVWRRGVGVFRGSALLDERWEQIPVDGITDSEAWTLYPNNLMN